MYSISLVVVLALLGSANAQIGKGHILFEYWFGGGINNEMNNLLNHADWPDNPHDSEWRNMLEGQTDWNDNYGTRVRGYLYPPGTGEYTFWLATDDDGRLLLSTDDNPANAEQIAEVEGWVASRDFDNSTNTGGANMQSSPISLVAGNKYYIEVRQSEGGGGDNLAVAWQGPGIATRQVIAGEYLSPLIKPEDLKAANPQPADGATGILLALMQWQSGVSASWHDVYFGTTPDLGPADLVIRNPKIMMVYYHLAGLTPGMTYYWRVDEVEIDGVTIHPGDVWSFTAAPYTAYDPDPRDGARYISTDVTLSWSAGISAIKHDVYFGTDETAVASGTAETFKANQQETTYTPIGLEKGTRYYWRIDEVEGDDITKHPGEVWSFRTRPDFVPPDPNMEGWWKLDDEGTGTAIDYSGNDRDGTLGGDPEWVLGYDGDALSFDGSDDYVRIPSLGINSNTVTMTAWVKRESDQINWSCILFHRNAGRACGIGFSGQGGMTNHLQYHWNDNDPATYNFASGLVVPDNEWAFVALVVEPSRATLYLNGTTNFAVNSITHITQQFTGPLMIGQDPEIAGRLVRGAIDDARIYSRALTAEEIKQTMRGDPLRAWDPSPADRSVTDVERAAVLSWQRGDKAAQHDVYLGTDRVAVEDADASDTTGVYRGRQGAASYMPSPALEWNQTYYWRVDEYNIDTTISTGRIWSFTVTDYLIVDDFEDYNDYTPDRVWQTWHDGYGYNEPPPGYGGNGTGSQVGNDDSPFTERTTVHGGLQAMTFRYTNNGSTGKALYSEAEREWATPQDWTRKTVKALTLWFYGDAANSAEPLYVGVQDSLGTRKDVPHVNSDAALLGDWQEWNIDLEEFADAGVNLTSVKKLIIGAGNRPSPQMGGTGTLYFDDIRLYRPRCVASLLKPEADVTGDCVVDYADLQIMSDDWLLADDVIATAAPIAANLVGHWKLDGNANDSSGNANHGTLNGSPQWVSTGKVDGALKFDGVDDYVDTGYTQDLTQWTISCWVISPAAPSGDAASGPVHREQNYQFNWNHGNATFRATTAVNVGGTWHAASYAPLEANTWYHLAATYDGSALKAYRNGVLITTNTAPTGDPSVETNSLKLGRHAAAEQHFSGTVDEVRVYSEALTQAQVAYLADETPGDGGLHVPVASTAELYSGEPEGSQKIDLKDYAELASAWLDELLWPQP